MTNIITKIMVELLLVLALATKHIKQGRFSKLRSQKHVTYPQCSTEKFVTGLWRKDKIQAALDRLDRLTKDEGLSAGAETLHVVHGIAEVVIGGAPYSCDFLLIFV